METAVRNRAVCDLTLGEPSEVLARGRKMARAWAESFPEEERLPKITGFVRALLGSYWANITGRPLRACPLSKPISPLSSARLDRCADSLAKTMGQAAAELPPTDAGYLLAVTYSVMLPSTTRSRNGTFYTPPALVDNLVGMTVESGIDWATARVLDPACGGGAFLAPIAIRMTEALRGVAPRFAVQQLSHRLAGFELDPLGGWIAQVITEAAVWPLCARANMRLPRVVTVCDSLDTNPEQHDGFDLVIGNPPYGRTALSSEQRSRYARSLHGHANLYGVFTDLALRWTRTGGVIAYVTPTSFLSGQYYKALRRLLEQEAPPVAVDFVTDRKGVFEDVQQETLLATYRRGGDPTQARVHFITVQSESNATVNDAGSFRLPADNPSAPWILPRAPEDAALVAQLEQLSGRLPDYGYHVATGPLVWNRYKTQLRKAHGKNCFPLIWAESILASGEFLFQAQRRNHKPFFHVRKGDDWLTVDRPCILVQRTTAKEQQRRLIAAELPRAFLKKYGQAVVENHINMIRPARKQCTVSPGAVAALLNSEVVDRAFRCISGSVAVSAFELEALPLPAVEDLENLEHLLATGADRDTIEKEIAMLYHMEVGNAIAPTSTR